MSVVIWAGLGSWTAPSRVQGVTIARISFTRSSVAADVGLARLDRRGVFLGVLVKARSYPLLAASCGGVFGG
jgi:hypothetical protein